MPAGSSAPDSAVFAWGEQRSGPVAGGNVSTPCPHGLARMRREVVIGPASAWDILAPICALWDAGPLSAGGPPPPGQSAKMACTRAPQKWTRLRQVATLVAAVSGRCLGFGSAGPWNPRAFPLARSIARGHWRPIMVQLLAHAPVKRKPCAGAREMGSCSSPATIRAATPCQSVRGTNIVQLNRTKLRSASRSICPKS